MLLLLLILSLAFGQLGRLELTPGVVIYVHDFLVGLLILVNLPYFLKPQTFTSHLTRPTLAFTLAAIISLLVALWRYPPLQVLTGSLYLFRWLAYTLVYFVARRVTHRSEALRFLSFTGLAVAVTGLVQYWLIPDTRFLYDLGWDEHYYRLIGTFFDPNFTGIFLVLTMILIFSFPHKSILHFAFLILNLAALLLTYSRSSYLAFMAVVSAYLISRRHKLKLLVTCCLFLIALFLLPRPGGEGVKLERLYSLTNRFDTIKAGWAIFRHHPLTGIGFNLLRGMDNSFIFILATTGIPGFLAYLWLLKNQLAASRLPRGAALRGYALLAIIIHSLFNHTLFYAPVMLWLWLFLALKR